MTGSIKPPRPPYANASGTPLAPGKAISGRSNTLNTSHCHLDTRQLQSHQDLTILAVPEVGLAFCKEAHHWFIDFVRHQVCGGPGMTHLHTTADCKQLLRLLLKVQEWARGPHSEVVLLCCGRARVGKLQGVINDAVIEVT